MKLHSIIALLVSLYLVACSNDSAESPSSTQMRADKETAVEHGLKHQDPKFVCPMHPQIIRDQSGTCPLCGMDLVIKESEQQSAASGEKKILYWVAPMDPNYRRGEPGKSPMGMDLVPVYDEGGGATVKISPNVENNLGVRTASAERGRLWRRIDTVGYVDFNENKISHIHLRTKGWIDQLLVKSEGERVKKGQKLFELYSPELITAQEEYLQALRINNKALVASSDERLKSLGIPKRVVSQLKKTRQAQQTVPVYASQDGIIASLNVREGMYVEPMREVMALADLASVWLLAEVFESQSAWVKVGQPAEVRLSYHPGRLWEGTVEYIYPSLNPKTRTLKVRLRFDNPDETLKPNMFATVTIYGGAKKDLIIIPREALIRAGAEERVIIAQGEGSYAARTVTAGMESGDQVAIISGLKEGEEVVTSGQFLIDSEASLKASLQRMTQPQVKKMESAQQPQMAAEIFKGKGTVSSLYPGEQKIKINHQPIAALEWPSMNMDFQLKEGLSADDLKIDDEVVFDLKQTADGYVIQSISQQ